MFLHVELTRVLEEQLAASVQSGFMKTPISMSASLALILILSARHVFTMPLPQWEIVQCVVGQAIPQIPGPICEDVPSWLIAQLSTLGIHLFVISVKQVIIIGSQILLLNACLVTTKTLTL